MQDNAKPCDPISHISLHTSVVLCALRGAILLPMLGGEEVVCEG
jgi:hypothetical protein